MVARRERDAVRHYSVNTKVLFVIAGVPGRAAASLDTSSPRRARVSSPVPSFPLASGPDPRALPSLRVTSWSPMGAGGDLGKVARARRPNARVDPQRRCLPPRVSGVPNPATPTGATAKAAERLLRADADARASAPAPSPTSPRPSPLPDAAARPPHPPPQRQTPRSSAVFATQPPPARSPRRRSPARPSSCIASRTLTRCPSSATTQPSLPPRPKLPAASTAADPVKAACVAVRARAAQAFIDALQYNHTSETYFRRQEPTPPSHPRHRTTHRARRTSDKVRGGDVPGVASHRGMDRRRQGARGVQDERRRPDGVRDVIATSCCC